MTKPLCGLCDNEATARYRDSPVCDSCLAIMQGTMVGQMEALRAACRAVVEVWRVEARRVLKRAGLL